MQAAHQTAALSEANVAAVFVQAGEARQALQGALWSRSLQSGLQEDPLQGAIVARQHGAVDSCCSPSPQLLLVQRTELACSEAGERGWCSCSARVPGGCV